LTRPQHHSALFYYDQVLVIDPTHDEALGAPRRIAGRYAELGRGALDRGDAARARKLLQRGLGLDRRHPELLALARELDAPGAGMRLSGASTTPASTEVRGESPTQLYRRVKSWFN
jgi:hypothetical protein